MGPVEVLRIVEVAAVGSVLILGGLTAGIAFKYRGEIKEAEKRKYYADLDPLCNPANQAETTEQEPVLATSSDKKSAA